MNRTYQYIITATVALLVTSCAVPKVAEVKEVKPLPSISDALSKEKLQNISLKDYFGDAHLVALFAQVKSANPDIQIAQQRLEIANSFLQRSKMAMLPSLEVGVLASADHFGKYTMEGIGNRETNGTPGLDPKEKIGEEISPNYWLGARSTWEVDAWGKLKHQKLAAQKRFLASEKGVQLLHVELFTDVAQLYYQLISLDNKLAIYQENYSLQQKAFALISAQREVGKATELAVQQFKAQNNNILAEIEHIKAEIVAVEQAISTLTGQYEVEIKRNKDLISPNIKLLSQNIDVNTIIHARPDVAANYLVLESTHADAKAARAAFYPKLELGAKIGFNAFSAETLFSPSSLAGQLLGGFMVPIFNKAQLQHDFKVANAEQEIAFLTYQKSVTTAFNELQSVLKQMKIFENVLKLKTEEVEFLDKGIEVSNSLYLTGYANYLELITSQKSKLQGELDLLTFRHQNTQNAILLFKALGGKLD